MKKTFKKTFLTLAIMAATPVVTTHAADEAPKLNWPLACKVFQTCFIESYPDLKMGTDPVFPMDYKCGNRSRPGVAGTEIVFTDRKSARGEQPVLAAAEGRVTFVENGIKERRQYSKNSKRACGNHVIIRHNPTYATKYCFMREGSIVVEPGQKVDAGDVIGQVGSSGATEAPKLLFEVLTNNQPTDPFSGRVLDKPSECFSLHDKPMWAEKIIYPPVGIIAASFAQGYPTAHDIAFDASVNQTLPRRIRTLTAWVRLFGVLKGDEEKVVIYQPNGQVWYENKRIHTADAPFWTSFASANFKPEKWPAEGEWRANYTLVRDGEELLSYDFFTTMQ